MADFVPPDPLVRGIFKTVFIRSKFSSIKRIQQELGETRGSGWWDEVLK